jgi:hypothetical protein
MVSRGDEDSELAAGESAGYEDPSNRSGAKKVPNDTSHHEDTSPEAAEPWRGLAAITPMQGALGLDATKWKWHGVKMQNLFSRAEICIVSTARASHDVFVARTAKISGNDCLPHSFHIARRLSIDTLQRYLFTSVFRATPIFTIIQSMALLSWFRCSRNRRTRDSNAANAASRRRLSFYVFSKKLYFDYRHLCLTSNVQVMWSSLFLPSFTCQ